MAKDSQSDVDVDAGCSLDVGFYIHVPLIHLHVLPNAPCPHGHPQFCQTASTVKCWVLRSLISET